MFGKIRSLPTGPDHATTRINKRNSWFELLAPTVITVQRRSWFSTSTAVFKPDQGFGGLEILWTCLFDHLPQIATYFVTFPPNPHTDCWHIASRGSSQRLACRHHDTKRYLLCRCYTWLQAAGEQVRALFRVIHVGRVQLMLNVQLDAYAVSHDHRYIQNNSLSRALPAGFP